MVADPKDADEPNVATDLPPPGVGRIYGGRGLGAACALCGAVIDSGQIDYEIEWTGENGPRRAHFHLACYEQLCSQQET